MSSDTPEHALPPPPLPPGAPPVDDALPGMKLGDYVVEKAVAWGGMGIVYRAVHPLLGRSVAVKVLRPNFASDPEQAARFLKEAQAISAIKHRGIIDIISFGNLPDGRQYMVMEFLDGETLEEVMKREGPMSPVRALGIIDEVLDALSAAHKVGVVHRDLKPSNVYIAEQSNGTHYVKLVDFGLARRAPIADLNRVDEKASLMAGTPEYLSPEQVKGLAATPRTDLYSLGVMMFEMVTGRLPFNAGSVLELLNAHRIEEAPRASSFVSLPSMLDDLIANCMQKQPELRPSSAGSAKGLVQRMLRQLRDDHTHVVQSPIRPAEMDKTVRVEPIGKGTDRIPSVPASMLETIRPDGPRGVDAQQSAPTDPNLGKKPLPNWVFGAGTAAAVVLLYAVVSTLRTVSAVEVDPNPPHAKELSAPVETEVAPLPKPEPQPVAAAPEPTEPVPPKKEPPPVVVAKAQKRPAVVAAPAEPVPEVCLNADWKDQLGSVSGALFTQYARKVQNADPAAQQELDAITRRISKAAKPAECAAIANQLKGWRLKYLGK